jgi:cyclophilin family peptidyl-prolyl cis-trans isomerase
VRSRTLPGILTLACLLLACPKHPEAPRDAGYDAGRAPELSVIAQAEDRRRAADISDAIRSSHDVQLRRAAARALSRIADADAEGGLVRALEDEDPETTGWGAYGLGFGCKGKEDPHVRALAARAASLGPGAGTKDASADDAGPASSRDRIDPRMAIARAVGRCGSTLAEQVLVGWVRSGGPLAIPAAYGLGDVARSHGALTDDDASALLDAAEAVPLGTPPALAYLYPFGRVEQVGEAWNARVIELSRRALAKPSDLRSYAIRALTRSGRDAADDLARVVESHDFSPSERAEAGRGLSLLGEAGRSKAGAAIARLAPDKDPYAIMAFAGDEYGVMLVLIEALGGDAPKEGLAGLRAVATLSAPGAVPAMLARRIAALRCAAANALANGAYDAEVLVKCDADGSEIKERARLAALIRRPLVGERRAAWVALAKSNHPRVREAALESIARHAELAEVARVALTDALASPLPGVVATATDVLQAHPDRVMVLSAREVRNALDPAAPPPTNSPNREIDHATAKALEAALARPWSVDLIETRVGLLDAAAAVRLPSARVAAEKACHDSNATVREHAMKDLRALGEALPTCASTSTANDPTPPGAKDKGNPDAGEGTALEATRPWKVTFETDAGELSIVFEPDLAPVAAAHFVALARQGFYKGILVHRVVPGFVAQFGDPGGDGYGGAGSLLRCETAPVPFGPLDVGVALSGRDTGSSQVFVALGRYPHLDGEYARVGHALGDWGAVAEGDVIHEVKVED